MSKPNYTKPTSQVDLEARQAKDYVSPAVLGKGIDPQPSENGFIGTDPIYQNFANETEKPLVGTKGAEAEIEKQYYADDVDFDKGATPAGQSEAEEKKEEGTTPSGATTPSTPSTPSTPTPPKS